MEKLLISISEATKIVGLGRTKLLALVYSGQISSVTVGRRRFILPGALRAFVASLQEEAQAPAEGR